MGQSLATLLVEIRVALDRGHAGHDDLIIIEQEAENAIQAVRALAYQVRRQASLVEPLAEARRYGERLLQASGAGLRWVDTRASKRLSAQVAKELGWTIRESITNALKHGLARVVEVALSEAEGRIRITVRDDGVGFDPSTLHATPEGRGLGLIGNAERMANIGGICTIRSRPGEGTVIVLEAPRFLPKKSTPDPSLSAAMNTTPVERLRAVVG